MSKTYNETRCTLKYTSVNEKNETETSLKVATEKAASDELEAAQKNGTAAPEIVKSVTFVYHEAESLADLSSLVPNESEAVNIFNRGYVLKQQSIIRDYMLDEEFAAPESGSVDLLADAAEVRERRKATPAEKAMKALSALSADEIAAILAQFQAQASA
jgi:hypothetical protein